MEDPSSLLVDSDPPWQIPYSPPIREEPLYVGIRIAENEGWFKGYGDGTLRLDETITAAQIAKVVDRLYPDGATRAEVANFLAAGSIGVL